MSFRWPLNSVAFDATECWPAIDTFDTASNNNDNDNQPHPNNRDGGKGKEKGKEKGKNPA